MVLTIAEKLHGDIELLLLRVRNRQTRTDSRLTSRRTVHWCSRLSCMNLLVAAIPAASA